MRKKFKPFLSGLLAAAVLAGAIPAGNFNTMAAEDRLAESYTQALDSATTIRALLEGDSAELTEVNKSWEYSPKGKALSITAPKGEVRVQLPAFGVGITEAGLKQEEYVSTGDASDGDTYTAGNAGLADGTYVISIRTGDAAKAPVYNNFGFLARYKDENHYAGLSFDWYGDKHNWSGHYSTAPGRENPMFTNYGAAGVLKANTDYLLEVTYTGTKVSSRMLEKGSEEYLDAGSYTLSEGSYYTGEGGLAVRLSPGQARNVMIDNIIQKNTDGDVVRVMDFEDGLLPEYQAFSNRGTEPNPSLAEVSIVDAAGEAVPGFGEETVNKLTAAAEGIFVDDASPDTDKGIYSVKISGTTDHYGLVFRFKDADNYAAVQFDGSSWVLEGKKAGVAIKGIPFSQQPAALTAGAAHTLVLDDSNPSQVTLKVDDHAAALLGDLSAVLPDAGKVGLVLGEKGTLYTDAIRVTTLYDAEQYAVTFVTTPEDAQVTVMDEDAQIADAQGGKSYALKPGKYTYMVSAEGYDTQKASFKVTKDEVISVKLQETGEPEPELQLDLWYDEATFDDSSPDDRKGQNWQKEAMMLGNGYMGALIYGGIRHEELNLNEKTLWQGGPGTRQDGETDQEIYGNWTKVQEGLDQLRNEINQSPGKEVSTGRAQQLLTNSSSALFREKHGTYQPLCDMDIIMAHGDTAEKYRRGLDLDTATSVVEYTIDGVTYRREYFMSYPDNVLAARITADEPGSIGLNLGLTGRQPSGYTVEADANTQTVTLAGALGDWEHNENQGATLHGNGMEYEGQAKLINNGGTVTSDGTQITVSNADSVVILFTSGTDYVQDYTKEYKGEHPHAKVTERLNDAADKGYAAIRRSHLADYTEIYNRVSLDLGQSTNMTTDKLVDAYPTGKEADDRYLETLAFNFGRYLLIASSREGSLPANLQGVWNPIISPQWESDYHLNINMQMNYWMTDVLNMPEMLEPLTDYLQDVQVAGTVTAEQMYGYDDGSWIMHNPMNPFGHTGLQFYDAGFWFPEASAWTLRQLTEHYDFVRDDAYLEEIYPLIAGNTRYWLNYLTEDVFDEGVLICNPSCLPEQAPFTLAGSMSQQIVKDFLENYLALAGEYHNADADLTAEAEAKYTKVDNGLRVDEELGVIRDWKYKASKAGGSFRHLNQLYALYPSNDLLFEESEDSDLLKAAKRFLTLRTDAGTPAWSRAWRASLWARLGDGNQAYETLSHTLAGMTGHNLFMQHPPFQIDGNLGTPAAIAEMLLQSHAGYIDVLPALPDTWEEGSFSGFVARGNFVVDASWADHTYESITITSRSGGTLSLKLEDKASAAVTVNGQAAVLSASDIDGVYTMETQKGDVISIARSADVKPAPMGVSSERTLEGVVTIGWDVVPDADSYRVKRYEGGKYTLMAETKSNSAEFTDEYFAAEGATRNTSTQYVVVAVVNGVESMYSAYTIPENAAVVQKAELIGYWNFDDSEDRGANSLEGGAAAVIGGNISFEEGINGDAAVFNGTNADHSSTVIAPVELVGENSNIASADFSVSLWVKNTKDALAAPQTQAALIQLVKKDNPTNTVGTTKPPLLINYADGMRYGTSLRGKTESLTAQNVPDEWQHLAIISNTSSQTLTLYVNGEKAGEISGFSPSGEAGPLGLMFGQHRNHQWAFTGLMDEIKCYTGSLSAKEVEALYNEGIRPAEYSIHFTTIPEEAVITVTDAQGGAIEPVEGKKYFLIAGSYSYTASLEGYISKTAEFTVTGAAAIEVALEKEAVEPETYEVKFATAPEDAAVVVKDAQGNVATPAEGKTYVLEAGASYSYTVTADGYVTKSAGFTAGEAADISVELVKEDVKPATYKVTFATTPENAAVVVTDAQGKEVTPAEGKTYTLEAGSYHYTVSADGYVTKMAAVLVKEDETVSVELEKTTTPVPDPTPGDDGSDDGSDNGSGGQNSGSSDDAGQSNEIKAPKTGDIAPFGIIAVMIGLGAVSAAGAACVRRRKK